MVQVNYEKLTRELTDECQQAKYHLNPFHEYFSKSCVWKSIAGTRASLQNLVQHGNDWFHAFPDFQTKITNIEVFGSVVICDVSYLATHTVRYKDNSTKKEGVKKSVFGERFEKLKPQGAKIDQKAQQIIVFQGKEVIKFFIQEDTSLVYEQLDIGLQQPFPDINSELLQDLKFYSEKLNSILSTLLSSRELECLSLALSGFSSLQIGDLFSISPRTVETHLDHVYFKLGCFGKARCVDRFYVEGILYLFHDFAWLLLKKRKRSKLLEKKHSHHHQKNH